MEKVLFNSHIASGATQKVKAVNGLIRDIDNKSNPFVRVLALLLADSREKLNELQPLEYFYSGAELSAFYEKANDSYTVFCKGKAHNFTFNEMIESCELEHGLAVNKKVKGHESYTLTPSLLNSKTLAACFADEINFFLDNIEKIRVNPDYALNLFMARIEAQKEKAKDLKKIKNKIASDAKREYKKAQAAKLAGGVKVASRANVIGFGEELVHKSGSDKKVNLKQRNKAVELANRRVGFKAKENYNSSGAVRGGSSLVYTPANEKYKKPSHRANTLAINAGHTAKK